MYLGFLYGIYPQWTETVSGLRLPANAWTSSSDDLDLTAPGSKLISHLNSFALMSLNTVVSTKE